MGRFGGGTVRTSGCSGTDKTFHETRVCKTEDYQEKGVRHVRNYIDRGFDLGAIRCIAEMGT